jgi:hypothetical protein
VLLRHLLEENKQLKRENEHIFTSILSKCNKSSEGVTISKEDHEHLLKMNKQLLKPIAIESLLSVPQSDNESRIIINYSRHRYYVPREHRGWDQEDTA